MAVRYLRPDDVPALVDLRRRCFRHSSHADDSELARHFEAIFFSSPWPSSDIRPLVYETESGIIGFRGVFPRPMVLDGDRIWAAISTQFMVDPGHRGSCAIELLRAFFGGPQDVSFADLATPVARKLWSRFGGSTALLQSLYWTYPVAPVRYTLARAGDFGTNRWLLRAARPLGAVADILLPGGASTGFDQHDLRDWNEKPLEVETWSELISTLPSTYHLRPEISTESLRWILACLAKSLGDGRRVTARQIRDMDGHIGGWYAYIPARGGLGECLQIGAVGAPPESVVRFMARDAQREGCIGLTGRVQPEFLDAQTTSPATASRKGPYTLVHARDIEIAQMMAQGTAWFTRLEGEYWMSF